MFKAQLIIQFEPGQSEILGVYGDVIHVLGMAYFDKEEEDIDPFDCVIKVDRDEYMRLFNDWLDAKRHFCEKYKEYCESGSSIIAKDFYEDDPVIMKYYDSDTKKYEPQETPSFYVLSFEADQSGEDDDEEEEV